MKYLIIILLFTSSCMVSNSIPTTTSFNTTFSIKNEINKSIFDGFYDNDSTKISKDTYFLK